MSSVVVEKHVCVADVKSHVVWLQFRKEQAICHEETSNRLTPPGHGRFVPSKVLPNGQEGRSLSQQKKRQRTGHQKLRDFGE